MNALPEKAIQSTKESEGAWVHTITANDTGVNGSHQAGFYVPKGAAPLLFDAPGCRGENLEKSVRINWQDGELSSDSRFKYYGKGTRNEYRITRFGDHFPYFEDEYIGGLLILAKKDIDYFEAYILTQEEDINAYYTFFDLIPSEPNQVIIKESIKKNLDLSIHDLCETLLRELNSFPESIVLTRHAQHLSCNSNAHSNNKLLRERPDEVLLEWINIEYYLFLEMEKHFYKSYLNEPFNTLENLVSCANTILNRRKSRAGKSLENHLSTIFKSNDLIFQTQAVTEGTKRPDFIFPSAIAYHNMIFPADKLTMLGAKTTCKDRWRQILNEADRIPHKFLFTLQPSISCNQLKEMYQSKVTLVVPRQRIQTYPKEYHNKILTLKAFIDLVRDKQNTYPPYY